MPAWLNRTSKELLVSVAESSLPQPAANYIEEPDLSAVAGQPSKYWTITGDVVSLMDAAAQDAVDAAALVAQRDSAAAAQLDSVEGVLRAFMLTMIDELNAHAAKHNAILDAIDAAASLASLKTAVLAINDYPQRTPAQLRTTIRNKLGT